MIAVVKWAVVGGLALSYYTRGQLQGVPIYQEAEVRASRYHQKSAASYDGKVSVFLSHSHRDADIINQAIETLGSQGVRIYVDWKDESMPSVTSPETATKIKVAIKGCKKFVLLATNNALSSKWVPWELGIADSTSGMDNVAILPVTESSGLWTGSEYVGIYSRIEQASDGKPAVFLPGKDRGMGLDDWLRN